MTRLYSLTIVHSATGIVLANILTSKKTIKVGAKFLAATLNKEHHVDAWYCIGDDRRKDYLGTVNHKGAATWFK